MPKTKSSRMDRAIQKEKNKNTKGTGKKVTIKGPSRGYSKTWDDGSATFVDTSKSAVSLITSGERANKAQSAHRSRKRANRERRVFGDR